MKEMSGRGEVHVLADALEVARAAAEEVVRVANEVVGRRTPCTLALSTGRISAEVHALLAGEGDMTFRKRMPWNDLHVFWTEERLVPADHPESCYRAVKEALLSRVALRSKQVHRVRTEGFTAAQAVRDLETELRRFFREILMLRYEVPRFDLVLLELGPDGRLAGLLPGAQTAPERRALTAAVADSAGGPMHLTLTPVVLNLAANVIVVASGTATAAALATAVGEAQDPARAPGRSLRLSEGRLTWLVDKAAASGLPPA